MGNHVLSEKSTSSPFAQAAVERGLAARRAAAEAEVERLVTASLTLTERTGELEPRVSEIVREAGLSNQAFYRHFRSKHELLVAVLDRGVELLAGYLAHRMARAATPSERVREWLRGVLAQALDPKGAEATRPFVLSRGRLAEAFPAEVAASERRVTGLLHEPLAAGAASGELRAGDPERDAEALYWLAMGFVQAQLMHEGGPSPRGAEALESFALAGVGFGRAGSEPDGA
jgi:AcrR family transcriptional regulator